MAIIRENRIQLDFYSKDIKRYGLECAAMIFALRNEFRIPNKSHAKNELYWFPLSNSALQFLFPFWTVKKSLQVLQLLVHEKVIKLEQESQGGRKVFAFVKNEAKE